MATTVTDLILSLSTLPSGNTVLDHLKSVTYSPKVIGKGQNYIIKSNAPTRKQVISRSIPQVNIQNNSVQAIQQAIDEMLKHIGRATYTGK
jgi:hypothetical protein